MNQPTPAIVAQGNVVRMPRFALWLFCVAYILPGFLGRVPWKRADITAFGYMQELARGTSNWWMPTLGGLKPDVDALLPYWMGAWAMQMAPHWLPVDLAARIPFIGCLLISLVAVWYGSYHLARSPLAQPVAFAFGGEANPADYAHAIADGGLLAFIACLGLAQISHETTPALPQLCFTSLLFYSAAALAYSWLIPGLSAVVGIVGLALSGAPTMAVSLGFGCTVIYLLDHTHESELSRHKKIDASGFLLLLTLSTAYLATRLNLWRWRVDLPEASWIEWQSLGRLFLWFTWPTWPLAILTLWRWRLHLFGSRCRHLWQPIWFAGVACIATLATNSADRSLLLALPALAVLAAFALPTLGRSLSALIDWFTLIFFSGCAFIIWVVWISMQTGFPAQPAANVMRLAPGFKHSFSGVTFMIAVLATLTWVGLVQWRIGRHRTALWKSVVLPAGGTALCWLLLMTLWLPLLDFARSYVPMVQRTLTVMQTRPTCLNTLGINRSQTAALAFHGDLTLKPVDAAVTGSCPWLVVSGDVFETNHAPVPDTIWAWRDTLRHPSDHGEELQLYARQVK